MESGYQAALDLLEENRDIRSFPVPRIRSRRERLRRCLPTAGNRFRRRQRSGGRMQYILDNSGIRVTGFGDNQFLKAVTGGIPTVHFGYKTSGIRGAELLLDVIERGEKIPVEMKLGFRMVKGQEEEDAS